MTRSGEQTVFAGSEAKTGSEATDAAGGRSTAASPGASSATGNLWSGLAPDRSSSLSAADASAAPESGMGGSQAISLAVVGLGLAGLLGGLAVAAVRRQRVQVGRTSGRNEL